MLLWFFSLACAIFLADGQQSPREIDTKYSPGKEYVYDYESQVVSGLPDGAKTYSGLKLRSQVRIQIASPSKIKVQLTSPKLYKINDLVDRRDPTKEMLPTELFKELMDEDSERTKGDLRKPFTVSYVRGHVDNLVTEEDDSIQSVNMKKAVLSLLELNFNDRHSMDREVSLASPDDEPKIYRVVEPSVTGECETTYKLKFERRRDDGVAGMKLEKIRDNDRCLEKHVHLEGLLDGDNSEFSETQEKSDPVSAQSSAKYSIIGVPDQYIILYARATSQYHVIPFTENRGKISTYTNKTLTLVDSRPVSDQIRNPTSPMVHVQPLKAVLPEKKDPASPVKSDLQPEEQEEVVKKVEKLLRGLEELMKNKVEEETGDLMDQLKTQLKKLDKPSLDKVLDKVLKDEKRDKAKKVLVDILPALGTYPSVDVTLERMERGDIREDSETATLLTLGLQPKPDVFIVKRLMDYLETKKSRESTDKLQTRVRYLCLSALGHKMIKESSQASKDLESQEKLMKQLREDANDRQLRRDLDQKIQKNRNKRKQIEDLYRTEKEKIVATVKKMLSKEDPDFRILALKMASNLGYPELLPFIKPEIKDKRKPPLHRMEAVAAVRRMAREDPEKVHKTLVPVVLDRSEPDEVRSSAFVTFLSCRPSAPTLQLIAKSLEDEPSVNIGSLVYSSLTDLSNKTDAPECIKSLRRNSTLALRFGRKSPDSLQKSSLTYKSSFDKELRMGHSSVQAVIHSPKERTPRAVKVLYSTSVGGKSTDVFEIGMKAKGLDSLLDDILEKTEDTEVDALLKSIFHQRQRRSARDPQRRIREIKDKLGVSPHAEEKPEGHFHIKLFGHELIYVDFKSVLDIKSPDSSPDGKQYDVRLKDAQNILETLKTLQKTQKAYSLPLLHARLITDTGLPLKMKVDKQGIVKIDSDVRLERGPRRTERKSLFGKIGMTMDFKPSALMELRAAVEVDLKHIKSGVQVKGQAHIDLPMTMTLRSDPDKSKVLVKVKDQNVNRPIKLESRIHTVIKRDPRRSDDYPVEEEKKEIAVVDGADINIISLETDKETLGRKLTVSGESSVRRDDSSPLPPLNGRQVLEIKYEPPKTSDLNIQIQRVKEDKREEDAPIRKEGHRPKRWWPFNLFYYEEETRSAEDSSRDSRFNPSKDRSDKGFIDLEQEDLTIDYLKDKFRADTDIKDTGIKSGLVFHIADSDSKPPHQVQLSSLYQRDRDDKKVILTVELRRAPKKEEEKPRKIVVDMQVDIPKRDVKPSDLVDNEYQGSVQRQIRFSIDDNGKGVDTLLDPVSDIMTKTAKHLKKIFQHDRLDRIIDDVIDHVMEKYTQEEGKSIKDLVQKERKMERDVEQLRKGPTDQKKARADKETLKRKVEKIRSILDEISKELERTPLGEQKPEHCVQVLYILASQVKTKENLEKTAEKLSQSLAPEDKNDIASKIKELKAAIGEVRDKQRKHSVSKQYPEKRKARIETKPDERAIHSDLLDIEKKIITVTETPDKSGRADEGWKLEEITDDMKNVKNKIDEELLTEPKLDKMVRIKILEVLIRQKLAAEDIGHDIADMQKDRRVNPRTPQKPAEEEKGKQMLKQKDMLKKAAKDLSERLALAINEEKERNALINQLPMEGEEKMTDLMKIEVKQQKLMDKLAEKDKEQRKDDRPTPEKLKEVIDIVKETTEKLNEIIDKEREEKYHKEHLCPVFIRSVKVLAKQSEIAKKYDELAKEKMKRLSATDERDLEAVREIKKGIEKCKDEIEKLLKKAKDMIKEEPKHEVGETQFSHSDERSGSSSVRSSPRRDGHEEEESHTRSVSTMKVLKKAHKVESQQLDVKSALEKIPESAERFHDQVSRDSEHVKLKKQIYDIIGKLLNSQKDIDEIFDTVKEAAAEKDHPEKIQELARSASERLAFQEKLVRDVEKKLADKQKTDASLTEPVKKVQELKEKVLRQKEDLEAARNKVNKTEKDKTSRRHDDTFERSKDPSRSDREKHDGSRDLTGRIKIKYGAEAEREKTVSIMIYGKKSLEQLLFESDQKFPDKRDKTVDKYMKDKREPDDITSPEYKKLSDELNTYRHLHVSVVYEDSIPREIKELLMKGHQFVKTVYHKKLSIQLPDETISNRVEIRMELRKDNKHTDVQVKTSTETDVFRNIRSPEFLPRLTFTDNVVDNILTAVSAKYRPGTCDISPNRIKTLKGRTIEVDVKQDKCEKLLAADCSPRDSVAITSKPLPEQPEKKVITVLTKDRKIELIPGSGRPSPSSRSYHTRHTSDDRESPDRSHTPYHEHSETPKPAQGAPKNVKVKIDEQTVDVKPEQTTIRESVDKKPVHVKKNRDGSVEVKIPHLGISVRSDGHRISIKVPQTYFGKLCGLCDTMDGDEDSAPTGPQQAKYSDPRVFMTSFMIPEDQCEMEKRPKDPHTPEIWEKSKPEKPSEKTDIKEIVQDGIPKTCFSIIPVKTCPRGTRPDSTREKSVPYHCVHKTSPDTAQYMKLAKVRILDEIRSKSPDYYDKITQPKRCISR